MYKVIGTNAVCIYEKILFRLVSPYFFFFFFFFFFLHDLRSNKICVCHLVCFILFLFLFFIIILFIYFFYLFFFVCVCVYIGLFVAPKTTVEMHTNILRYQCSNLYDPLLKKWSPMALID